MYLITNSMVNKFEKGILDSLRTNERYPDSLFTSHMWLASSEQKRSIYGAIYRKYLFQESNLKILDVGGGYSSLTRLLVDNLYKYELVDPMYHDYCKGLYIPILFPLYLDDWYKHEPTDEYDVIIANDLFPNVDQRLELFLEKYLKCCHKMILSLTYYNKPTFYDTKRIGADEHLYFLAYNGEQLALILHKFKPNILHEDFSILYKKDSIFSNGRQVCIITLEGDL